MKRSTLLRLVFAAVASAALSCASTLAFAQHGGHGGGGGFHSGGGGGFHGGGGFYGGGGGGFHGGGGSYGGGGHYAYGGGGHFYGGYHGGGYGWRGGYNGWHGSYWGYPGYGYGWGLSIGFGWGSYWPAYSYGYGYSPWWGAPYYVPSGYPYPYTYNGSSNASPPASGWNSYGNSPTKPSRAPAPVRSPNTNSMVINVAASRPTLPDYTTNTTTGTASHFRLASTQQVPPDRREVQNVIRALRAMPPDARQRQIDSGRYSNFSPEERELLLSTSSFQ